MGTWWRHLTYNHMRHDCSKEVLHHIGVVESVYELDEQETNL